MQQTPHEQVTNTIEEMKNAALRRDVGAIERCSNTLFALTAAYMMPQVSTEFLGYGFTNCEIRLIELLARREGQTLTKDCLLHGMYFDRPDCDWPELKIIDVFVCKLRRKLEGTPHEIETVWGLGYRYVRKQIA